MVSMEAAELCRETRDAEEADKTPITPSVAAGWMRRFGSSLIGPIHLTSSITASIRRVAPHDEYIVPICPCPSFFLWRHFSTCLFSCSFSLPRPFFVLSSTKLAWFYFAAFGNYFYLSSNSLFAWPAFSIPFLLSVQKTMDQIGNAFSGWSFERLWPEWLIHATNTYMYTYKPQADRVLSTSNSFRSRTVFNNAYCS